ncbi:MAG TPA: alpha-L-fucosidase, partial [Spirochaetales bacterium]|nr:alpha-L-fucosidase [Spirochaetales bacterium]
MTDLLAERERRVQWFQEARFGMFIHWGLYSIPAKMEWVRSVERMGPEAYREYFDSFDPAGFEPREWARLAKRAGMKYAVLTAKHHDGFCLFDSKLTDFKATNTRAGRDLVAEYLEAFRAEGIEAGLYFSLIDWEHPDYPHYGDRHHPQRDDEAWKGREHRWERYLAYLHGQVRELCANYGKLPILWFDFSYGEMSGERWGASELIRMVRSLQPDAVIDNRLEASGESLGSMYSGHPTEYAGDFASPEQIVPPEGVTDVHGKPLPWEACVTMNNHWGYSAADRQWKSPRQLVRKLVECVAKGGNLILNVGPDARGRIPEGSARALEAIGRWMSRNSPSIYGCGNARRPKPEWGYFTAKGGKLYAHVFETPIGSLCLPGLGGGKIARMRLLADGSELRENEAWNTKLFKDCAFVNFGEPAELTHPLPDEDDTV